MLGEAPEWAMATQSGVAKAEVGMVLSMGRK